MNVLLVDDEPMTLVLFGEHLKLRGHDVTPCETAIAALKVYQQTFYPLIVTDLGLPVMDGLEFCRRIRALPQGDQTMILVITARDAPEDLRAVLDAGADDYLLKPVSHDMLNIRLTIMERQVQVLAQRRQAEEERLKLETRLRQSQRLEALGVLAGGIAHDFNNILGTMMGYAELLLTAYAPGVQEKSHLEQIYQAGERATDLVQQILTFSRAQEHLLKPTEIAPIIQDSLKMIRATTPANIEIRSCFQPDCHPILADVTQIHQVIINLCLNARYAMRRQGGILEVSLDEVKTTPRHLDLPPGTYLKLSVRDSGCGMTSEVQERIFEPFFTTKEVGEGSGLGLSVVHGIMKSHKGAITVESESGKGSSFDLFFPITKDIETRAETARINLAEAGKEHILLVEDELPLLRLYEIALTKLGYQVTVCSDSLQALETFRANPAQFDLVFTDQAMPDMTGAELSQALLRLRPDLPIILTTGYSETLSEKEALALGIRQFLQKPVKFSSLIQAIQDIFATRTTGISHKQG